MVIGLVGNVDILFDLVVFDMVQIVVVDEGVDLLLYYGVIDVLDVDVIV